jgi:hypothetical protein
MLKTPLEKSYGTSAEILAKCISLPNGVVLRENFLSDLKKSLEQVIVEIEING